MKTKNFLLLFAVAALLGSVTACKKYEDGPAVSLLTKKQRLCRTWFVRSVTSGSIGFENPSPESYKYEFQKNGTLTITQDGNSSTGSWSFADNKEDLSITVDGSIYLAEIRRLTKKELWLEQEVDDTDYLIKLEAE